MNVVDIDELLDELEACEDLTNPPKPVYEEIDKGMLMPTNNNVEENKSAQSITVGFPKLDESVDLDDISDSELEAYLNAQSDLAEETEANGESLICTASQENDAGEYVTLAFPAKLISVSPTFPIDDSVKQSVSAESDFQEEEVLHSSNGCDQETETKLTREGSYDDFPAILDSIPAETSVDELMDFSPKVLANNKTTEYPEDLNPFALSDANNPEETESTTESVAQAPIGDTEEIQVHMDVEVSQPSEEVVDVVGATAPEEAPVHPDVSQAEAVENPQSSTTDTLEPKSLIASTHDLGSDWILQLTESEMKLGKEAPTWIPDMDTDVCMICENRFSLIRRRHHCRACGRVLCGECCNCKAKLPYMEDKDVRVCVNCDQTLKRIAEYEAHKSAKPYVPYGGNAVASSGNPKIPPGIRVLPNSNPPDTPESPSVDQSGPSGSGTQQPTSLDSALVRSGSKKSGKQVTFRDGIKPGGDLTEPPVSHGRLSTKSRIRRSKGHFVQMKMEYQQREMECLISESLLPNFKCTAENCLCFESPHNGMEFETITQLLKDGQTLEFIVKRNLRVFVKIVNLDCCANLAVWNFYSDGLRYVGQEEILLVIEKLSEEDLPSTDVFEYFNAVYDQAYGGLPASDLEYTLFSANSRVSFSNGFLNCKDFVGICYVKPSFQCLNNLSIPQSPFLIGLLFQRWEAPWVKIFPQRLILRLGAECGSYPSPVVSLRSRRQVFFEIGHTILTLLADFRNYSYTLATIPGASLQLMPKKTLLVFPKLQYSRVVKVINSSNEHVLAFGLSFSTEVDSQLVCIQQEDGVYQSQIISRSKTPNVLTGASFIVFNGSLKSGVGAKSSIVEDGVMIQIRPEAMELLKEKLKSQESHTILCGDPNSTDHLVFNIEWIDAGPSNDPHGLRSPIDGVCLSHLQSHQLVAGSSDIHVESRIVRLSTVFVHSNEESSSICDGDGIARLSRLFGIAIQNALASRVAELMALKLNPISLRITVSSDEVEYSVGSLGERLPQEFNEVVDSAMVPVLHQQAANQPHKIILELLFHILTVF